MKRPLCSCGNPVAVNYIKNKKTYYRKKCDSCIRNSQSSTITTPAWQRAGYQKNSNCEMCGFNAQHPYQLDVFYIDSDMNNNNVSNLKTVCANCNRLMHAKKKGWRQGDLTADY